MTIYSSETQYKNEGSDNQPSDPPVNDGELCTYEIAKSKGIADENNIINPIIISKDDQKKINMYTDDGSYDYKLCNKDNNDYYYNCALHYNNIWLTKTSDNKCEINEDIVLSPDKIEKEQDYGTIKNLKKPPSFSAIKNLSHPPAGSTDLSLCSDRWYDWFTIPDFHNGNKYTSEFDGQTYSCFKPCKFGSIITSETDGDTAYLKSVQNKCINRDLIDNGRLKNTLLFTPYAIIFLFGLTKNDLLDLYNYEISNIESIVNNNNNNVEKAYDIEINYNLLKQITDNDTTLDNIVNDVKNTMKISIDQLITEPISHLNIISPHDNLSKLNYAPKKYYSNEKYIKKAYDIASKLYKYLSDVSLKSDFYLWKKQLEEINGYDINSWEFNKVLLLLQASCSLCFGYQNPKDILYKKQKEYNEYIMNNIFKFNDENVKYRRINYPIITNSQILKSIDTNNPFNNMEDSTLRRISSTKIKKYQLENIDNSGEERLPEKVELVNICDIKFYNHDNTEIKSVEDFNYELYVNKLNLDMIDNCIFSFMLNSFNCFIAIITIIIFMYMSYLLIILIWPNIANVVNYIIMGFIWIFATFMACYQALNFRAPNRKGIILEIHKLALEGEYFFDNFLRTLAILSDNSNLLFYFILGLAGAVIAAVIFKSCFDLIQIFIADSNINKTASNNQMNILRYIFCC